MQGGWVGEFPECAPEPMHGESALLDFFARTEFSASNQVGGVGGGFAGGSR